MENTVTERFKELIKIKKRVVTNATLRINRNYFQKYSQHRSWKIQHGDRHPCQNSESIELQNRFYSKIKGHLLRRPYLLETKREQHHKFIANNSSPNL